MRATIKDVAKAAGVSPSTVSLVLNRKPVPITRETRERVLRAAESLHYRPNQLAVGLVTNTTNTVGVILPDSNNPYFAALSNELEVRLRKEELNVIIGNTGFDPEVTRQYLRIFSDRRVDGIVLAQLDFEDPAETASCRTLLEQIDLPVVLVDQVGGGRDHVAVAVDQVRAGYLAGQHLLKLGHRRIGCAAGSMALEVNRARYRGFCQALEEFHLSPDPDLLCCGELSLDWGRQALPRLAEQHVTALFAFNDMIAYGVYQAARDLHLSIPRDLSVVGVDDIPFSDIIHPPLTTVAQPVHLMALHTVESLLQLLGKAEGQPQSTVLRPELMVRGSTAPLFIQ